MANTTAVNLIATVRARAGRSRDTVLITAAFALAALNEAQLEIVRRSPGLLDLDTSSTTDLQLTTADTTADISTLDPAHIQDIWIMNGSATRRKGLTYMPRHEFYRRYMPVAEQGDGEPYVYTLRASTLIFNIPVASDYNNLYLRVDYTKWATPFPTVGGSETSDLLNSDKGLILFALAEIYDEIALMNPKLETKALKTRALFEAWLNEYQDYNDTRIEDLHVGD